MSNHIFLQSIRATSKHFSLLSIIFFNLREFWKVKRKCSLPDFDAFCYKKVFSRLKNVLFLFLFASLKKGCGTNPPLILNVWPTYWSHFLGKSKQSKSVWNVNLQRPEICLDYEMEGSGSTWVLVLGLRLIGLMRSLGSYTLTKWWGYTTWPTKIQKQRQNRPKDNDNDNVYVHGFRHSN